MSFLCILIYLFLTFIRPQEWVSAVLNKPLINIISIVALIFMTVERLAIKKVGWTKVPQFYLMIGLFFAVLMSHISHTYFGGMIASFNTFLVIFILFFLLLNGINTEMKFKVSLWFIVLLITILVFQGMYQKENFYGWGGQPITTQGGVLSERIERINWMGIFNDPNDLALTFVMAVGIVLAFLLGKTGFVAKIINLSLLSLLLYGIFLTNSRGGLLALMTTIYFFFVRRTKKFVIGGIVGGILALAILVFGPSRAGDITVSEASAFSRVELWWQGIDMLRRNPLFGVGFNMFTEDLPQTAHNSFILAGAELGFVGLFFWMALIYSSFKGLLIIQNKVPKYYNYALGLQTGLVGFCAAAVFLSRTYVILPYILFAYSGALMHLAEEENKDLKFRFSKKDAKITALLSIGIILLCFAVTKVSL